MYTVVHFENDDSVEAVPSYWFSNNQCAWPVKGNIKRFIQKKIKPNDIDFTKFKARKLSGEISSLSDAKRLATKAMCTSNLSGDDLRAARMKKKISKNIIKSPPVFQNNDSSVDDDDSDKDKDFKPANINSQNNKEVLTTDESDHEKTKLYNPDKNKNQNKSKMYSIKRKLVNVDDLCAENINNFEVKKKSKTSMPNTIDLPIISDNMLFNYKNSELDNICYASEYQSSSTIVNNQLLSSINDQFLSNHQPSFASKHQTSNFYHQPSTSTSYNTPSSTIQSSATVTSLPITGEYQSTSPVVSNQLLYSINDQFLPTTESCVDILNKIYKLVLGIKLDVKENSYKITRLEKAVCDIKEVYGNNKSSSTHFVQNERFLFPIKNQKELELFEKKLDDANFKSDIVLEKSLYVRDTVAATVRCILYKMFDDNLLVGFSYIGQKKKHSFSSLKSNSVIFDAVRQIRIFQNVPEQDIKNPIKIHLAQARARLEKKKIDN